MRYEAYHNIAKRLAQVNFNFKNITLSVANHLQLVKGCSLMFDNIFEIRKKTFGPLTSKLCSEIIDFDLVETTILKPYTLVNVASWVKVQGWEYRENSVVLCKFAHESSSALPDFAIVKHVIVLEEEVYLLLQSLKTTCFNEPFHSFQVEFTRTYSVTSIDSLAECEPLWITKNFDPLSDVSFVSPRHIVLTFGVLNEVVSELL